MPYKFLEGITVADVAFEASGATENEMFESAAEAVTSTMVKDLKSVKANIPKKLALKAPSLEQLLFDFLQELVFLKDAKLMLYGKYGVKVSQEPNGGKFKLAAELKGEKLNPKKHELLVDVKAVTWHEYRVWKEGNRWKARVVLDV
ncbi:archease [Candidatus Micrarchaeota archaeon]|nr:archease [Candidatus Micrarchaeota archaeon]